MAKRLSGGLELQLEGGEAFVRQMRAASKEIKSEFVSEGRQIAKEFRKETRGDLPKRSGTARRELRHFARGNRDGVTAGVRSSLIYHPALHFGSKGKFGATMTSRYGRAPRFAFDVREKRAPEWGERLLELVVQAALTVHSIRRG